MRKQLVSKLEPTRNPNKLNKLNKPNKPNRTNRRRTIRLSEKRNGYGGAQVFFLCPTCGKRVRFLYICRDHLFKCRVCARLNYQSQQETKDDMFFYRRGMSLAEKHLVPEQIDAFSFCDWIPPRPRYQHQSTYQRHIAKFTRFRERHAARQMEDLQRILQRL